MGTTLGAYTKRTSALCKLSKCAETDFIELFLERLMEQGEVPESEFMDNLRYHFFGKAAEYTKEMDVLSTLR